MPVKFKLVIPARYASSRLPGKPLLKIAGKAMILHVCERALQAHADEVVVATDNEEILHVVISAGFAAVMTRADHSSGTERIAEVVRLRGWDDSQIVVNLQGDEPLIPANYLADVAQLLASQKRSGIATLAAPISEKAEIFNPNAVKVVLDNQDYALYFSRAPIPWDREQFVAKNSAPLTEHFPYLRHIGIYAYTVGFIKRYINWRVSPLETIEILEQLRILWHGESVKVLVVARTPEAGIDTQEDVQRVERLLQAQEQKIQA